MSTQINVTVDDGGIRAQLQQTVAQNRERRQEQIQVNKISELASSDIQAQIAYSAGISLSDAAAFLANATAAQLQQVQNSLNTNNFDALASQTRGSGAPTFYRKPETSAQKEQEEFIVGGVFIENVDNLITVLPITREASSSITNLNDTPDQYPPTVYQRTDVETGDTLSSTFLSRNQIREYSRLTFIFPAGRDSCVVFIQQVDLEGYSQISGTENTERTYVQGDCTEGRFRVSALNIESTFSNDGNNKRKTESYDCFFVSRFTVKQIPTPPTLLQALNFALIKEDLVLNPVTPEVLISDTGIVSPIICGQKPTPYSSTTTTPGVAFALVLTDKSSTDFFFNGTSWQRTDATTVIQYTPGNYFTTGQVGLLYQQSNKALNELGNVEFPSVITPGTYQALQLENESVEPGQTGAQIVETYFSSINVPGYSLKIRYDEQAEDKAYFDVVLPITYPLSGETTTLKKIVRRATTYDNNLRYYWDWNNPSYCQQQLLALGFSAQDLRP